MEKHVVISVGVPVIRGAALPTASGGRLQRMGFEDPVADVNHVNILFDDDVARKRAIVDPIAQATFGRRRVGPGWPLDVAGKIISFPTDNLAKGAVMDAPDHFDEWRAIANLEPDIQAELSFGVLADFNHFQCSGNINRDGLFKIDVLAGVDRSFQMPGMIIRWSGDDNGVQFLGGNDFLVSIGAGEKLRGVNRCVPLGFLDFVEVRACSVELVAKQVAQGDHARAGVDQIRCVFSAARAATQQTHADRGVGGRAVDQLGLNEHHACGGGRQADKFAAIHLV